METLLLAPTVTMACLLQWSHEDRNNASCRSPVTCLFARWPKVDLFPWSHCCPSYLAAPTTEDIISMRHQVLSPAQRSFSLSCDQKTRKDFRASYLGIRYKLIKSSSKEAGRQKQKEDAENSSSHTYPCTQNVCSPQSCPKMELEAYPRLFFFFKSCKEFLLAWFL